MLAAEMIMYPPTNSLISTNGPSGAGCVVTSREREEAAHALQIAADAAGEQP
jgi:hypothetical protein